MVLPYPVNSVVSFVALKYLGGPTSVLLYLQVKAALNFVQGLGAKRLGKTVYASCPLGAVRFLKTKGFEQGMHTGRTRLRFSRRIGRRA